MRIEKERQCGSERERWVRRELSEVRGGGWGENELLRGHRVEDLRVSPELDGDDDDGGDDRDVDDRVFDDGDERGRAQAALVRVRGEDHEGDDERQIRRDAASSHAHRREDDLDAHELERDVRHRREDARQRHGQREEPAVEAPAHEVGGGDVSVAVRDAPHPRHRDEDERVRDHGVRQREEAERARAEDERRHRHERVGRVEVTAEQKPRDHRAEAAPREAPFVELVEVSAPPARGDEPQHGDEREEDDEYGERGDVGRVHRSVRFASGSLLGSVMRREVHDGRERRGHRDEHELVPVEEGDAREARFHGVVERHPQHSDERHDQERVPPGRRRRARLRRAWRTRRTR